MNPEGLVVYPETPPNEFQILSDDGTRKIDGMECKAVPNAMRRHFRSFWVEFTALASAPAELMATPDVAPADV